MKKGAAGLLFLYLESSPQPAGNQLPTLCEHSVAPVYYSYVALSVDALHNIFCHRLRFHHQRVGEVIIQQCCIHEPRADICNSDVQLALASLLLQRLQISGLQGLSG